MAYPFLNMLSYWVVVPACLLMLISFLVEGGAAAAGWTLYAPLSGVEEAVPGSGLGTTLWLLAMALFIASFTMGSLNFLVTIVLMIGVVTFLGVFAGCYFWFPKMFGRMMNDRLGRVHFWLTVVPMFIIFILNRWEAPLTAH